MLKYLRKICFSPCRRLWHSLLIWSLRLFKNMVFSGQLFRGVVTLRQCLTCGMEFAWENNSFYLLTVFAKILHHRYFIVTYMCLRTFRKYTQPAFMFQVNNKNIRTRWRQWSFSGVFLVNFWTYFTPCSTVSLVDFELVNAGRDLLDCIRIISESPHD